VEPCYTGLAVLNSKGENMGVPSNGILHNLCSLSNIMINPSTPELTPFAQRCLPRYLMGILIFKGLTARRLYKSFSVKGLSNWSLRGRNL
jgi:hypothetical protein